MEISVMKNKSFRDNILKMNFNQEDILPQQEEVLMSAIKENDFDKVKRLVTDGIDVNYANERLETPLHIAMSTSNTKIIKYLVENGANVSAKNIIGRTPLFYTKMTGYICEGSRSEKNPYIPTKQDLENIKILLQNGANLSELDELGLSVVHWAIVISKLNSKEVFRTLFEELGGEIDIKTSKGNTPLYYAVMKKDVELVKLLLEYGANKYEKVENDIPIYFQKLKGETNKEEITAKNIFDIYNDDDIEFGMRNNIASQIKSIYNVGKLEIDKKRKYLLSQESMDVEKLDKKLSNLEEKFVKWNEICNALCFAITNKKFTGFSIINCRNIIKHLGYIKRCYIKNDFTGKDFEERVNWDFSPANLYFNVGNENFHCTVKIMGNELKELTNMNRLEEQKEKIRVLLDRKNLNDMNTLVRVK